MKATEYLKEGNLAETLSAVKQAVREDPSAASHRTFLFQLLAITGEWDRALNQLNVAGELDPAALPMVQAYREALACEAFRERVFAGERTPLVFGDPEQWIALVLESLKHSGQGHHDKAALLRDEAYESAPEVSGSINGEAFQWIADADSRIGPFIEAVVNGKYYWIPVDRIASVSMEPPEDLRDLVWIPGQFAWANGGEAIGFIPVRYPGSQTSSNDAVALARMTDWEEVAPDVYHGVGQRMFATDQNDYPLLEIRELKFDVEAPAGE